MKKIINVRAILVLSAVTIVLMAIAGSFFYGYGTNKLVSLIVGVLLLICGFLVYPLYAKVTADDITIVYFFGIYRKARWKEIDNIVRSRGLFKEFYFYPTKSAKKSGLKADFPATKKMEAAIRENWRGILSK